MLHLVCAGMSACTPSPQPSVPVEEPQAALRTTSSFPKTQPDQAIANYVLTARLDAQTHQIHGTAQLTWRNSTSHPSQRLPFHLYMNAFRGPDSEWMKQLAWPEHATSWGSIEIQAIDLLEPGASPVSRTPISWQLDDEPTVMWLSLPKPVKPGEHISLEIAFRTQLPQIIARTGFFGDFHMVGQWFPKIGVLAADGQWQCHPFTYYSEFYADFGNYEVQLDVPAHFIVGATGIRTHEELLGDRKILHYRAEMVHDFAWTADPNFQEFRSRWADMGIRHLFYKQDQQDIPAHQQTLEATIASMEQRFGSYPWSTITVVHPPLGAEQASGMEYPTLFTTSKIYSYEPWQSLIGFEERLSGHLTTAHEFGHQTFQGLLASNEFKQPWLDEGVNTMANVLTLSDAYPVPSEAWLIRFFDQTLNSTDLIRLELLTYQSQHPVDSPAHAFTLQQQDYATTVYRKPAAILLTLRNLVGHSRFDHAMRVYAERWRFAHPQGSDLFAVFRQELGEEIALADDDQQRLTLNLQDFLQQAFSTIAHVDFEVAYVGNHSPASEGSSMDGEAVAVIRRNGDFRIPVEFLAVFNDETTADGYWDGQAEQYILRWPGKRLKYLHLDPQNLLVLEAKRLNNTRFVHEQDAPKHLQRTAVHLGETANLLSLGVLGL